MAENHSEFEQENGFSEQLGQAAGEWQRKLINELDTRNNLLYLNFSSGKRGTRGPVIIEGMGLNEIVQRLEEAPKGLTFDHALPRSRGRTMPLMSEDDDDEEFEELVREGDLGSQDSILNLQAKLRNLRQKAQVFQQEQGLDILYLAVGMLRIPAQDDDICAPVLLMPVKLESSSPAVPFVLSSESDDIAPNDLLIRYLADLDIQMPAYDSGGEKRYESPESYLDDLRLLIKDHADWEVEDLLCLNVFSYSKLAMVEDFEHLKTRGTDNPVVKSFAGIQEENQLSMDWGQLQTSHGVGLEEFDRPENKEAGRLDDLLTVRDQSTILPADGSQLVAIMKAKAGANLIIHGPPGTGKSQTIANIIAALLTEGKSVLFVSEKAAALEVVKRKLDENGLGGFCLDLHPGGKQGLKKKMYDQLKDYDRVPLPGSPTQNPRGQTVEHLRKRLNEYTRALHVIREPMGKTIQDIQGIFINLKDVPDVDFEIPNVDIIRWSDVEGILGICDRIARYGDEFSAHTTSRWLALRPVAQDVDFARIIRSDMSVLTEAVSDLTSSVSESANIIGCRKPENLQDIDDVLSISMHLEDAPGIPSNWLNLPTLQRLEKIAQEQADYQKTRTEALNKFAPLLVMEDWDYREMVRNLTLTTIHGDSLEKLLGPRYQELVVRSADIPDRVQAFIGQLTSCLELIEQMKWIAPSQSINTFVEADELIVVTEKVASLSPVPNHWIGAADIGQRVAKLEAAKEASRNLRIAEASLFENYEEGIVEFVDTQMLRRYRTYNLFARVMSSQYRKDRRVIRSMQISTGKTTFEEEKRVVGLVVSVANMRGKWQEIATEVSVILGDRFQGLSTDWDSVKQEMVDVDQLLDNAQVRDRSASIAISSLLVDQLLDNVQVRDRSASIAISSLLLDQEKSTEYNLMAQNLQIAMVELKQQIEAINPRLRDILNVAVKDKAYEVEKLTSKGSVFSEMAHVAQTALPILERISPDISKVSLSARKPLTNLITTISALEAGAALNEIDSYYLEAKKALGEDFGARFDGVDTDWIAVQAAMTWTQELIAKLNSGRNLSSSKISDDLLQHCRNPKGGDYYHGISESIRASMNNFADRIATAEQRFDWERGPWNSWNAAPFETIVAWASDINEHADYASDWISYKQEIVNLERSFRLPEAISDAGAEEMPWSRFYGESSGIQGPQVDVVGTTVIDKIRETTDDAGHIQDIVKRRIVVAWINRMYATWSGFHEFSTIEHEDLRKRFRELDEDLRSAARFRARDGILQNYPNANVSPAVNSVLGTFNRQLRMRRRQLSPRNLLKLTAGSRLTQKIKPCFMMSPLAVSQILPFGDVATDRMMFDTVIFDEASQIFPEDAIPAIMRAEQVIVAGDALQLPPSNFFTRQQTDVSTDEEDNDNMLLDMESILDVAITMKGAGQPFQEAFLEVHYRSQHEHLIEFSNRYIYDRRLETFPSSKVTDAWNGVRDVHVQDGEYRINSDRPNPREAEKVVDLIFDHMRSHPNESLGVVAMSGPQRDHILNLLRERRLLMSDVEEQFSEEVAEPYFVKNLESVQGDERDHIILTIGYGKDSKGRVANRFGPLNQAAGIRRLNVAITRARRRLTVVHSLLPSDIRSETAGPRLLARFLEYVADPSQPYVPEGVVDPDAESESPFEESVGRAIESRGYRIVRQVGVSKYRVDIGILSEDGSGFDLGIECDGRTYHSSPTARDRDWQREQQLRSMGWSIHRIWSTSWMKNPQGELEAVEAAIREARENPQLRKVPIRLNQEAPTKVDQIPFESREETATPYAPALSFFETYEKANIRKLPRGSTLQYETTDNLVRMLTEIIKIEGPVHLDVIIERLREIYGIGRVHGGTRDKVRQALLTAAVRNQSQDRRFRYIDGDLAFYWDNESQLYRLPRKPRSGDTPRSIQHIFQGEIRTAIQSTLKETFGGDKTSVIAGTARNLGYARSGSTIQETIGALVDVMIRDGEITSSFNQLILSEESDS